MVISGGKSCEWDYTEYNYIYVINEDTKIRHQTRYNSHKIPKNMPVDAQVSAACSLRNPNLNQLYSFYRWVCVSSTVLRLTWFEKDSGQSGARTGVLNKCVCAYAFRIVPTTKRKIDILDSLLNVHCFPC